MTVKYIKLKMSGKDRILQEFKDINRNPITNCGVTVGLINDSDITKWRISLLGPKDTSYSGGLFYLTVDFPQDYPQRAPEICFLTPIYHVNVNPRLPRVQGSESLGHVCISTLNWWKPEYKMREVLTNIFALFYMGNPDSPYGLDRADEYRNNRAVFEEKIKHFTKKYANPLAGVNSKYLRRDQDWNFNFP